MFGVGGDRGLEVGTSSYLATQPKYAMAGESSTNVETGGSGISAFTSILIMTV